MPAAFDMSDADATMLAGWRARRSATSSRPAYAVDQAGPGAVAKLSPASADAAVTSVALMTALGTTSVAFADRQLNLMLNATARAGGEVDATALNGALAAVAGLAPRDEVEAMLACQMAATNDLAMELLRRTRQADPTDQMVARGNLAVKLMRTYAAQLEALARYRNGGTQRVVVERVNVEAGGQAIVGAVTTGGGGG